MVMLWNSSHCINAARAVNTFGLQVVLCNAKLNLAGVPLTPTVAHLKSEGISKLRKKGKSS